MSAAAPAVKRSRREVVARRPEEEKWAMSSAPASASKVATVDERRNVMRNLPDPRHFPEIMSLMKQEVKKDLREMERDLVFARRPVPSDEYGDSSLSLRSPTGIPPLATDTFPPQVLPDTQAMAKRKRYARWDADPSLIEQDLAALRSQVAARREVLTATHHERSEVDAHYHLVSDSFTNHVAALVHDKDEAEVWTQGLIALALKESGGEWGADQVLKKGRSKSHHNNQSDVETQAVKEILTALDKMSSALALETRKEEALRAKLGIESSDETKDSVADTTTSSSSLEAMLLAKLGCIGPLERVPAFLMQSSLLEAAQQSSGAAPQNNDGNNEGPGPHLAKLWSSLPWNDVVSPEPCMPLENAPDSLEEMLAALSAPEEAKSEGGSTKGEANGASSTRVINRAHTLLPATVIQAVLSASDPVAALRECLGSSSMDPKFVVKTTSAVVKPKAKGAKNSAAAAAKSAIETAAPPAAAVVAADGSEPIQVCEQGLGHATMAMVLEEERSLAALEEETKDLRSQLRSSALEHMALLEHLKTTGQESASLNATTATMQLKCARLRKAYPECAALLGGGTGTGAGAGVEKEGSGGREGRVSSGKATETALQEDEDEDEEEEDEAEAAQAVRGAGWMGGMSPSAQAHNAMTPGGSSGLSAGFGVHTMAEAAAAASAHANAAAAAILGVFRPSSEDLTAERGEDGEEGDDDEEEDNRYDDEDDDSSPSNNPVNDEEEEANAADALAALTSFASSTNNAATAEPQQEEEEEEPAPAKGRGRGNTKRKAAVAVNEGLPTEEQESEKAPSPQKRGRAVKAVTSSTTSPPPVAAMPDSSTNGEDEGKPKPRGRRGGAR